MALFASLMTPANALLILFFSTISSNDTTELYGVEVSISSFTKGFGPGCLLLLLKKIPLESMIPPNRSLTVLIEKKEGLGDGPKVNWPVSSRFV